MLARLLLIRHGQTDWNRDRRWQGWSDVALNETGLAQAAAVAERLRNEPLDAIYASDLIRAAETARQIGAHHKIEPVLDPGWREIALGELEGVPASQVATSGEAVTTTFLSGPLAPGAETFDALQGRLVAALKRIVAAHAGQTVAVVSHGGALRTLIAHVIGLAPQHIHHLSLRGNTGVTMIDFRNRRPQLTLINCIAHLR